MKKLCCDICGGALTMQSSGKTAVCDSCGMQYSVERMREKVQKIKGTVSVEGTVRTQDADFIIRGGVLERYNGNDTDVIIPDSVVKIGEKAFADCLGIKSVAFCPGVIEIGRFAFSGCKLLERIEFSDALEIIGGWAFCECRSLKKVTLPEAIKTIGSQAFYGSGLEVLNIPEQVEWERMECGAFENCPTLREVIMSEDQKEKLSIQIYSNGGCCFPAQAIFERKSTDGDDYPVFCEENCGPWYLSLKSEYLQKKRKMGNVCQHCGGSFTGFFTTKCSRCGKPKDY